MIDDVNLDGEKEFINWNGGEISIYQADSLRKLQLIKTMSYKYVNQIDQILVTDMNLDEVPDLILFAQNQPPITLLHTLSTPTATPVSPTPTQTPQPIPTPTMTPYPYSADAIVVSPSNFTSELINNASDDTTFIFEPGIYISDPHIYFLENKTFSIIGKDPNRTAVFHGIFEITNCNLTLQNIAFNAEPNYFTGIYARNSNLTFINNYFNEIKSAYFPIQGWGFPGGPAIDFINATNKTLTLVDNEIEFGSQNSTIDIQECENCTIKMEENPRLGVTGQSIIKVIDSSNIDLYLNASHENPVSLTQINASNSSMNVFNGVIEGQYGGDGILPGDGYDAVRAFENSHIIFHNTIVLPGKGGDGLTHKGNDGKQVVKDESSNVEWVTSIIEWLDFDNLLPK